MTRNCPPVPAVFGPLSFLSSPVCPKQSEVVPISLPKGNALMQNLLFNTKLVE